MKVVLGGIAGLLVGLLCLYVAVAMGGGGHGWVTPFFFSLPGTILFPLVAIRLARADRGWFSMSVAIVILAVVLDILLLSGTMREGVGYMHRVGAVAALWLSLWALWQIIALVTLVLQARAPRRTGIRVDAA